MELWDVNDAARFLKVHPETVRVMARSGRMPRLKVGGRWRFSPARVAAWVDAGCPSEVEHPGLFEGAPDDDEAPTLVAELERRRSDPHNLPVPWAEARRRLGL